MDNENYFLSVNALIFNQQTLIVKSIHALKIINSLIITSACLLRIPQESYIMFG